MKKLLLTVLMIFYVASLHSQAYEGSGDLKLNAGFNAFGNGSGLSGTLDYGLTDLISVGAGLELYFNTNDKNSEDNYFIFGRASVHLGETFNMPSEWDIYPGLNLGIIGDSFGLGAHIGARYFFTENLGAFAELGTHGAIGVSFNF